MLANATFTPVLPPTQRQSYAVFPWASRIKGPDHEKVFREVFRVLKSGGLFLIWDVIIPQRLDVDKDIAAFPLLVKLPDEEINAGYGVLWPEEEQDLSYYVQLAENVGFNIVAQREKDRVFFLKLRKP